MELTDYLTEIFFRKRTKSERKKVKRKLKIRRRGTDFKLVKPKKGYKRTLDPSGRHYSRERLSAKERLNKKRIGRALGKNAARLKK